MTQQRPPPMMVQRRSLVERRPYLPPTSRSLTHRGVRVQRTREAFVGGGIAGRRDEGGVST